MSPGRRLELDRRELRASGVEVEALRVLEGVGYEGSGTNVHQVRRCTADVRLDVEGRTYTPRVELTLGECDSVRMGQRMTVVASSTDPSRAFRTFDPALAGSSSGPDLVPLVIEGVMILALLG